MSTKARGDGGKLGSDKCDTGLFVTARVAQSPTGHARLMHSLLPFCYNI